MPLDRSLTRYLCYFPRVLFSFLVSFYQPAKHFTYCKWRYKLYYFIISLHFIHFSSHMDTTLKELERKVSFENGYSEVRNSRKKRGYIEVDRSSTGCYRLFRIFSHHSCLWKLWIKVLNNTVKHDRYTELERY